jgi:iron complex outermembrane receptor protein
VRPKRLRRLNAAHSSLNKALSISAVVKAILLSAPTAMAQTAPATGQETAGGENTLQEVVVTGTTSTARTLLTASADITPISEADLAVKAPRSTDEVLELIPGMFVEATAGAVSNNYSVRGLSGGGQAFIMFEEDGLPILYGGLNPDEVFSNDITIGRVEAVRGGSSGILTPNGPAATINFISRRPNFDKPESLFRLSATTYNEQRGDFYYSAPIIPDLAFSVGGYVDSTRGTRDAGLSYQTYHVKGALIKRWDDGAFLMLTGKLGDQHDPYYADMPFRFKADGKPGDLPGLDSLNDNIAGRAFSSIGIPDSCATGNCIRTFSLAKGIYSNTSQLRVDGELPVGNGVTLFAKAHYLDYLWDFNGVFPGSGTGNAGLATASNYLNGGASSPIAGLLTLGMAAYPGAAQFAFKDLNSGQLIAASNAAALAALNGNGLMEQTWLNHQVVQGHDIASNFGARWESTWPSLKNSLTAGGMYFEVQRYNDQSAVAHVINGVTSQSHIYDVVPLNGSGQVVGSLTDNGLVSYGDWGTGIWKDHTTSFSVYVNDEMTLLDKWHIDFGARNETLHDNYFNGNTATGPVPVGDVGSGLNPVANPWDGTFTESSKSYNHTAVTAGVNYTFNSNLSGYLRYENAFTMGPGGGSVSNGPTVITLEEGGVRYQGYGLVGTLVYFHTSFDNQSYQSPDPLNQAILDTFTANLRTDGVELDVVYAPIPMFRVDAFGVYQRPETTSASINGVPAPQFNGRTTPHTPKLLYTIQPSFVFPDGRGQAYVRFKYLGAFFADAGDGLGLPGYGVWTLGASYNVTEHLNLNVSVDNVSNQIGITEGNPRQGPTQTVFNGYFYGRGIAGRNALFSVTYSF